MDENLGARLKHAWNVVTNNDDRQVFKMSTGPSYSTRPDRMRLSMGNERSIVTSIFNRIALDVSALDIKHCRLNEEERYIEDMDSSLNECLSVSANLDQTGRALIRDTVMSMLDDGVVAVVPVDTTINPNKSGSYDILSLRTARILEWKADHVKIRLYNDRKGKADEIWVAKRTIAIVENPLYAVFNESNSTTQRLIHKLSLLDVTDEKTASGKLDLIIGLPYVIKTEARRKQAEDRRKDIEEQLINSKYGVAYTDGTEKITQLNRPVENNLMSQIEYLTELLFSQSGISKAIMDGTADEQTMLNYYNRTVEPIISAITEEFNRKFLTKTARSQHQAIKYFRDPFKLVPVNGIAEIADKFTRNEVLSSNEFRQILGLKPSRDPKADQLINSNINQSVQDLTKTQNRDGPTQEVTSYSNTEEREE